MIHTGDAQADPLLLPCRSRLDDCLIQLLVSLVEVLDRVLGLRVNVLNSGLLLHNGCLHVLEELGELDHLALDLLDGFVSALDGAQC